MKRRSLLLGAALAPLTAAMASSTTPVVEVWKSPTCGCCKVWVEILERSGFTVKFYDVGNTQMRARLGIPDDLVSCHTGRVGGYALEGHVPPAEIHRLLREKPIAVGLAVPGMPLGSPGMEVPGGRREAYDVLLVQAGGKTSVFNHYPAVS